MIKNQDQRLSDFSFKEITRAQLDMIKTAPFFDVELSSNCNVHCLMCPRRELKRTSSLMEKGLMYRLADWFPSQAKVMLAGLGEPILHPKIFEFLFALKKRGIETGITTNGLLLSPEVVSKLIESHVDLIQISFHATSKEQYNKIVKGGSFNKLMNNLSYLSEKVIHCDQVKLTATVQKDNENDIERIKHIADSFGFDLFLRNCHSRAGANYDFSCSFKHPAACGIFSKVSFIDSDGNILACCQDLKSQIRLGHIDQSSFSEILNKKKKIIEGNRGFSICRHCDDDYRYYLIAEHLKTNNKIGSNDV